MQGTIFQLLVLVTHGNAILSGREEVALYPQHPAFQFDEFTRFVDLVRVGQSWQERPFADDPNEWLTRLAREGCRGLRTERRWGEDKRISDRMSVAFVGGGGRWLIEAVLPAGSDLWEARWELGDRNHPERKIWRVTYRRVAHSQSASPAAAESVEALSRALGETLGEALVFAGRHDLAHFGRSFEAARAALSAADEPDLYGVALPGQLPLAAARLLAAAQAGWVFGGMGSWNDLGFPGDEGRRYETISDSLFRLINSSLVATANLSYPGQAEVAAEASART